MIDRALLEVDTALTMQAALERDHATEDAHGAKTGRDWQPLATVACFLWWGTGSVATRIGSPQVRPEATVDLNMGGMIFPEGTDLTARDRVSQVLSADGSVLIDSPLEILAVAQFEGLTEVTFRRQS